MAANFTSILSGMTDDQLRSALTNAQQAYIALISGSKGESFSYAQGEGSRSVTYTRANLAQLTALIRQLQQQLGLIHRARRPVGFYFR